MAADFVLIHVRSRETGRNIFVIKDRPTWQKGRINLPGGHVESNESPRQAAKRELEEETGISVSVDHLKMMGLITDNACSYRVYCFSCELAYDLEIQPRDGETESFFWEHWSFTKDDKRLLPNLKFLVPMMAGEFEMWVCIDENAGPNTKPYKVELIFNEGYES